MDKQISKEILDLVTRYRKEGVSVEHIHNLFSDIINNIDKPKRSKKKTKKICRPVLFISDSSCDEIKLN